MPDPTIPSNQGPTAPRPPRETQETSSVDSVKTAQTNPMTQPEITTTEGGSEEVREAPERLPLLDAPDTKLTAKTIGEPLESAAKKINGTPSPENLKQNVQVSDERRAAVDNAVRDFSVEVTALVNDPTLSAEYRQVKMGALVYELFFKLAETNMEYSKVLAERENESTEAIRKWQIKIAKNMKTEGSLSSVTKIFSYIGIAMGMVFTGLTIAATGGVGTSLALPIFLLMSGSLLGLAKTVADETGGTAKIVDSLAELTGADKTTVAIILTVSVIVVQMLTSYGGMTGISSAIAAGAGGGQNLFMSFQNATMLAQTYSGIVQGVSTSALNCASAYIRYETAGYEAETVMETKTYEMVSFYMNQTTEASKKAVETALEIGRSMSQLLSSAVRSREIITKNLA